MYYQAAGCGEPVVYVHGGFPSLASVLLGLPRDRSEWGWEHDFADHFRFVSYDRRGCYRSSCPENGYGLIDMAEDLEGLLDELSIPSVHLIGSSAGGPIATAFAATRAGRTRSLSLTGTASNLFPPDDITKVVAEQIGYLDWSLGPRPRSTGDRQAWRSVSAYCGSLPNMRNAARSPNIGSASASWTAGPMGSRGRCGFVITRPSLAP